MWAPTGLNRFLRRQPLRDPLRPTQLPTADEQIDSLLRHHDDVVVVADEGIDARLRDLGHRVVSRRDFVDAAFAGADPGEASLDGDDVALLLYTSGTTAAPKAAVLRHRHLACRTSSGRSFGAADDSDAVLVCVPPYHIAGVANLLSNTYLGRRIVYLDRFDPELWLDTVPRWRSPTPWCRRCWRGSVMRSPTRPTRPRRLCGRCRMAGRAHRDGPRTDHGVVPEHGSHQRLRAHRDQLDHPSAEDPAPQRRATIHWSRARLRVRPASCPHHRGRATRQRRPVETGEVGDVWSGVSRCRESTKERRSAADGSGSRPAIGAGSTPTGTSSSRAAATTPSFVGAENIAPAEIEEVLLTHPDVRRCAVVGVPDDEWGQRIAAVVVLREGAQADADALTSFARGELRGSKTPDVVSFADRPPVHRDRQAPAPPGAGRSRCRPTRNEGSG